MSNPLKDLKLSIEGLELSLEELKLTLKNRGIKGYKNMSEDDLLRSLTLSKPVKKGKKLKNKFF